MTSEKAKYTLDNYISFLLGRPPLVQHAETEDMLIMKECLEIARLFEVPEQAAKEAINEMATSGSLVGVSPMLYESTDSD